MFKVIFQNLDAIDGAVVGTLVGLAIMLKIGEPIYKFFRKTLFEASRNPRGK